MPPALPRSPWILEFLRSGDECQLHLWPSSEGTKVGSPWPDGITPDVCEFIERAACCHYCGSKISLPLKACACGHEGEGFYRATLVASINHHTHGEELSRLIKRQQGRVNNRRRAAEAAKNGGTPLTSAEKQELLEVQQGMCFYCGCDLVAGGKSCFHHDHFVPVAHGGRTDLENAVLACGACNAEKRAFAGYPYLLWRSEGQSTQTHGALLAMRAAFARWRKARSFRSLRQLDPARSRPWSKGSIERRTLSQRRDRSAAHLQDADQAT